MLGVRYRGCQTTVRMERSDFLDSLNRALGARDVIGPCWIGQATPKTFPKI